VPEPVVVDTDGDGITDDDEMNVYGTDPYNADTDMDGISDSQEISSGADPLISNFDCKIWLEAEKGVLHTPFEIADDAQSSDNSYIWVPNGGGSDGYAEYTFEIQESGDYVFWGRALSSSGTDNSFYVSVDNSESIRWNTKVGEDWIWDPVNSDNASDPLIYYLEEGTHTLIIKQREDGTKIDRILITNILDYIPQEMGEPVTQSFPEIWIEAETGELNYPMVISENSDVSAGGYIWVPNGGGSDGYAEYTFEIQESGDYVFWGRALSSSGTDNSFYVSVDNSESIRWNTKVGEDWIWDPMNSDNASLPIIFYLDEGTHSLIIKQREDGTKLDKILITNDIEYLP
jgi:hypothetical protein